MNSSETFTTNPNRKNNDVGAYFGESKLSDVNFEPRDFPEQSTTETDRDFAERGMRADERIFLVGLVKAETQGPDGMVEALNTPDFRLKRSQRREFLDAVGKMSEEEYGKRVDSILGVFDSDEEREAAMDIADYYWLSAKKRAGDEAALDEIMAKENAVSRTHHEKPRKYRWRVEPEMPKTQAEVMLANPQKYYREQKQERRGKKLLEKVKGFFAQFKKEEEIPRRVRSEVRSDDFADEPTVQTPQVEAAMAGNVGRRHEEDGGERIFDFDSNLEQEPVADGYPAPIPAGKLYRQDRGPLHTNDFSFGEEGSF